MILRQIGQRPPLSARLSGGGFNKHDAPPAGKIALDNSPVAVVKNNLQ
jgi:hypothetical protein